MTVGRLRQVLRSADAEERAYWLGALLREANSRDVWLFTTPEQIRSEWPNLIRHLGRSRSMWAWLLDLPDLPWPRGASSRTCASRTPPPVCGAAAWFMRYLGEMKHIF